MSDEAHASEGQPVPIECPCDHRRRVDEDRPHYGDGFVIVPLMQGDGAIRGAAIPLAGALRETIAQCQPATASTSISPRQTR